MTKEHLEIRRVQAMEGIVIKLSALAVAQDVLANAISAMMLKLERIEAVQAASVDVKRGPSPVLSHAASDAFRVSPNATPKR